MKREKKRRETTPKNKTKQKKQKDIKKCKLEKGAI